MKGFIIIANEIEDEEIKEVQKLITWSYLSFQLDAAPESSSGPTGVTEEVPHQRQQDQKVDVTF